VKYHGGIISANPTRNGSGSAISGTTLRSLARVYFSIGLDLVIWSKAQLEKKEGGFVMATLVDRIHFDNAGSSSGLAASEAIAAIVAIVLTILGLALVAPALLVAIATIAVGVGLVFQGVSIATSLSRLVTRDAVLPAAKELAGGSMWSIQFLAGGGGIVLGILALLQVRPSELVAIAAIAYGGALIISSSSTAQLNIITAAAARLDESTQALIQGFTSSSAGGQAVSGLAAIVLGILALAGFSPIVLVLIALLQLGSFILLNGSVIGGLLFGILQGPVVTPSGER
jgi:hypothetical protein